LQITLKICQGFSNWLPGPIAATNPKVKQNASYSGEKAPQFASSAGPTVNTPPSATVNEALNLIHLIHTVWRVATRPIEFLLNQVPAVRAELARHSVGSRTSTSVPSGSSRMKEAARVSGLTEDKRHEVGKALECSV
jgi:hypothetical protein